MLSEGSSVEATLEFVYIIHVHRIELVVRMSILGSYQGGTPDLLPGRAIRISLKTN